MFTLRTQLCAAAALLLSLMSSRAEALSPLMSESGPPTLVLAPFFGLRYPTSLLDLGLRAQLHLPRLININARTSFSLSGDEFSDESMFAWQHELYAGYPLFNWRGSHGGSFGIDQSSSVSGNTRTTTTTYRGSEVATDERFVVEGGLYSYKMPFRRIVYGRDNILTNEGQRGSIAFDRRLTLLAAGARWVYSWNHGEDERNQHMLYAHVLVRGLGTPGDGDVFIKKPLSDIDPSNPNLSGPVGFQIGASWTVWTNAFANLDVEAGYLPGGPGWMVSFGASMPVWIF